jgi:hypothetical protein
MPPPSMNAQPPTRNAMGNPVGTCVLVRVLWVEMSGALRSWSSQRLPHSPISINRHELPPEGRVSQWE